MIKSDYCFWLMVHEFHAVPYVIILTSFFSNGGRLFDYSWYDEMCRKVNETNLEF